jgi:hypothetical protein
MTNETLGKKLDALEKAIHILLYKIEVIETSLIKLENKGGK